MEERGPPLVINSDRDGMSLLMSWMDVRFAKLGLGHSAEFAIRLCLEEAVQNALSHGIARRGQPITVKVWLDRAASGVTIVMEDDGTPFDPLAAALPERPRTLCDARIGGLGLVLIRRFAQRTFYERRSELNCLTLGFDVGHANPT